MTDAGQFSHSAFGLYEVLENLEARDHVRTVIGEWQHSSIRPDATGIGKSLEGSRQLVVSIFDSDERAGPYPHRFECQSLADADIDPGTAGWTCCHAKLCQQSGNQFSYDDVAAAAFSFILPCGKD
jgi:hypothetical protein